MPPVDALVCPRAAGWEALVSRVARETTRQDKMELNPKENACAGDCLKIIEQSKIKIKKVTFIRNKVNTRGWYNHNESRVANK